MARTRLLFLLLPALCAAAESRGADAACATCHSAQAALLSASVHAGLHCQQCHGGGTVYGVDDVALDAYAPPASGASRPVFDHGPTFTGKPVRRNIPALCGDCHADVGRMNAYGLRTDQLARYWTSGHGKTLASTGDESVAVCVDCHGTHDILTHRAPDSRTHPLNVPDTCGVCHSDPELMSRFDLPVAVVDEYRQSVHGRQLFEQHDTGAPTCVTCHGSHGAVPPGFAEVGAVCGRCHPNAAAAFGVSVHAGLDGFKGCVQCHGGGAERHFHFIQRITQPAGLMIGAFDRWMASHGSGVEQNAAEAIHPQPKAIIHQTLETCLECHDEPEDDESLAGMFTLLDAIGQADVRYARTGRRLNEIARGVLLVENQRFMFEDAKTHLIGIAPLQHGLDAKAVGDKIAEMDEVCDRVNGELDELERGLAIRHHLLLPIWLFAAAFATALYLKFRQLKARYVKPLHGDGGHGS